MTDVDEAYSPLIYAIYQYQVDRYGMFEVKDLNIWHVPLYWSICSITKLAVL